MKKEAPVYRIKDYCYAKGVHNIKIASFSENACTASEFDENHRHQYYEIVWLKKGKGLHNIDMIDYPYAGSVLFLLSPGQMHRIIPEQQAEGYVIKFLPALFRDSRDMDEYILNNGLFDNIQAQPLIKLSSAAHSIFEDIFSRMDAEFNVEDEDKEKILLSYLKILLTHINRLKKNQQQSESARSDIQLHLFQQYKIMVEKNYKSEHGVQYYAAILHTQPRTLNNLSKKYAGKTAGEIIADRIVLEAKRELYYNHISIKEIGYQLGFDDPAYFTRFFKKQTGYSPNDYKVKELTAASRQTKAG